MCFFITSATIVSGRIGTVYGRAANSTKPGGINSPVMAQPLEGITVADFSQMQQGAWSTMKLADMGAKVIKIEPPHGDLIRQYAMAGEMCNGISAAYLAMNRNKQSIAINLKEDAGVKIAKDIVRDADVLYENFRPGVMERFGLDYESVQDLNPEIVYVSGSGWGSSGPYAERPGQDLLAQAMSGITKNTGCASDPPIAAGGFICDAHSATLLAFHTLAALRQRDTTGTGQHIEGDLLSAGVDLQTQEITASLSTDAKMERGESRLAHPASGAPYAIYETSDDYLAMSFANLSAFAEEFDLEPICDYDDQSSLYRHRDEVVEQVKNVLVDYPTDKLVDRLTAIGMWVSPVKDSAEAATDPQVRHNEMIVELQHPDGPSFETTGVPVRMSEADIEYRTPPSLGAHTRTVLRELDYDDKRINELEADEVVQTEDSG